MALNIQCVTTRIELTMQTLTMNQITMVSGGCEEHCWGDFEVGGLAGAASGGAVAGSVAGVAGAAVGAVGGAVAYLLDVVWTD